MQGRTTTRSNRVSVEAPPSPWRATAPRRRAYHPGMDPTTTTTPPSREDVRGDAPDRAQASPPPSVDGAARCHVPGAMLGWEDFPPGRVIDCGSTTVSREAMLDFARQFDPQPFHVDEEAARQSLFGGLVASGWHTCAMAMRLMCDAYLLRTTSQGSPGIDELRWLKPVRPGDVLRLRMTVLDARPMRSKPDLGLVQSHWELFNQDDAVVLSMKGWAMFRRRAYAVAQEQAR